MKGLIKNDMNNIPILLIYTRLILGIVILLLTLKTGIDFKEMIFAFIIIGFLTDVFDGIIARKLDIDSDKIRRMDSKVDRIFWLLTLLSTYLMYPEFIKGTIPKIMLIFVFEFLAFLVSYLKFKKIPAPHNYLSKLWGCFVLLSLCQIVLTGSSDLLFNLMIITGVLSRIDSIVIYKILKNWERDIPSFYHAIQIKNGKDIKRTDLFN